MLLPFGNILRQPCAHIWAERRSEGDVRVLWCVCCVAVAAWRGGGAGAGAGQIAYSRTPDREGAPSLVFAALTLRGSNRIEDSI
jgi:hypothetical protein